MIEQGFPAPFSMNLPPITVRASLSSMVGNIIDACKVCLVNLLFGLDVFVAFFFWSSFVMLLFSRFWLVSGLLTSATAQGVSFSSTGEKRRCTVTPNGNGQDDVPLILEAFNRCGSGGVVVFPEGYNYTIAQRLNPVLYDCDIHWHGTWTMTTDIGYWRNHSYPIEFQNHAAGIVFTGDHIRIDGHGTGGINGNGDYWYTLEAGVTKPGRPMPFVFWNVSDVTVRNFEVKDPPLWAINIMNGTDMWFDNIVSNATATQAPYGSNWVQNTDGFDTMDAHNIRLTNFWYQGGDDCVAVKPRSFNIEVSNATCHGGNGMAIGSLGQYLEDASVENVIIKDVNVRVGVTGHRKHSR